MTNYMPLIHEARRSLRNRAEGNPFTTDWVLEQHAEKLTAAYFDAPNSHVAELIKVELDRLETLI